LVDDLDDEHPSQLTLKWCRAVEPHENHISNIMLFTAAATRSTLCRASLVSSSLQLRRQATKRTFASALTNQVASLRGVDFMSIDQLRCVRAYFSVGWRSLLLAAS